MKNKIFTILFVVYIFSFSLFGIFLKKEEISISERRKLKTFPEYSFTSNYINDVDKYFLDHFPLRDEFRTIKANFNYHVFQMLDNNGIYLKDNFIFKSEYPTNEKSISNFVKTIDNTISHFSPNNKVYVMIIPDKNYYLNDGNFLQIDYDYLYQEVYSLDAQMVDIRNTMELEDYYETDTHWRQEKILKVVNQMSYTMDFELSNETYQKNVYPNFYGVYYGESAMKRNPDELIYFTSKSIKEAKVYYMENKELSTVYNPDNLTQLDSYDVFLDGASAYIEIYNENSNSEKELVIFRDSFGSSIAPLLIESYKKITLIDNRYIRSEDYLKSISFTDQDVLFLYSTLIVNNSFTLKG